MKKRTIWLVLLLGTVLVSSSILAVSPTKEAIEKWKAEGVWEQKVANWKAFKAAGGCSPEEHTPLDRAKRKERLALGEEVVDTVNVIVLLAEFSDNPAGSQPNQFDSILFSQDKLNPTGSMTEFYMENSYGTFFIKGDIYGWYMMPEPYDYYVGVDDGMTNGRYVVSHAAVQAELAGVDFSKYDNNHDGWCDGLIVVHAGPGAESGAYGIWSHKGNLSGSIVYDGVTLSGYTMNPEKQGGSLSNMGVFAHEYGHFIGLPDLYDVDYSPASSEGVGDWSIMATGSWNGGGARPAHFDAWCKRDVGFAVPVDIPFNMDSVEIPCVEYNPVVYQLKNTAAAPSEYWLVENRQQVGFDAGLPGNGLLIYHIDVGAWGNTDPNRYMVAVEQADGRNDLAWTNNNQGDGGDPFPGASNNRAFNDRSNPSSKANVYGPSNGVTTAIGVWDITDSDSIMWADLDVSYSRPWVELSDDMPVTFDDSEYGDGDGRLEAGETVDFYCWVKNYMKAGYHAHLSVSCNNPAVSFGQNDVMFAEMMVSHNVGNASPDSLPIEIILANEFDPTIDTLWLTITSDALQGVPGTQDFQSLIPLEVALGGPQVLLVDDEASAADDYDLVYTRAFYDLRVPFEVWSTADSGSPTAADLSQYQMVFWHTGDVEAGAIEAGDVAAMREYMDGHGNLLLSTLGGIQDIVSIDHDFMRNYFGAEAVGTDSLVPGIFGVTGSDIGHGLSVRYDSWVAPIPSDHLQTINGGQAAFYQMVSPQFIVGVSFADSLAHSAVLLSFPLGYLGDYGDPWKPPVFLIERVVDFFGMSSGSPTDVGETQASVLPRGFELGQNYPNPFNPVTTISYTIRPTSGRPPQTTLSIFNMLGQRVRVLVDEPQLPGVYTVTWNGTADDGQAVATGVYFYRLSRGGDATTRKMVLLK
ncbi:MAG: M6 family metalloprotease domain-containing protein [bacterium]